MALTVHLLRSPIILLARNPRPRLAINSQSSNSSADTEESSTVAASPKKPASPGQGFGSTPSSAASVASKNNQKGKKERASITRRTPMEKPVFISKENESRAEELKQNESAFLLTWFGLGGVILFEGIALAASGFLPEEWDKLLVKYLYPVFTPTVLFFLAGTVAYGVIKYLQNESLKDQK